ncbi:outer membrane protein assembly factor BamC [Chromobacterium sp. IIBBL 290-4]|uniref:outer membrane protein assembly factor BamC n=1 Tax=Chromobacterium sp. IIBBL 290-4 TaxID=2953890 RepID=UPI0020B78D10|nr:outer membrane protein assembly factor BamC [Chromobacterium sp. IIBBL 290-4]UTH72524.1 outer membrane protein assembly factor BamC [Chromobacterium sp. IIBBL 290-4]
MKFSASAAILLAAGTLAACSSTQAPLNKPLDYKSDAPAKTVAGLEVPPDLTTPQIQNKFNLPGGVTTADADAQTAAAASPVALNQIDNVKMERAGTQRWLLVGNKKAAELWPVLKAFWQENGFVIKTEDPGVGIMETDWAENRAKLPNDGLRKLLETVGLGSVYSTGERDKFRIRLENTPQGTEVYFSHRGMEEVYADNSKTNTIWQARPTDPNLEAELLGRFMIRLGMTEDKAKAQVQQTLAKPAKPQDPIVDGQLQLNDGFDRAWRRVGLALDRVGLIVTDRDRSQGVYFVKPAKGETDSKDEGGGFWSSLAFWKSSDGKTVKPGEQEYRIKLLEQNANATTLQIQDKQGKPLADDFVKAALGKLQTELQ